jgi:hypothetical protein
MPSKPRETERPPGSCANQTPWLPEAAHSSARPLVQWPDTGFKPALIPAAAESRFAKAARLRRSILILEQRQLGIFGIHNRHAQGGAGAPWVDFGFAQDGLEARSCPIS